MKLSARLSAVAVIAGASVLVIASPAVAAPWASSQVVGGKYWEFNSSAASFGHVYDQAFLLSSATHAFGALYIDGTGVECDESTADVQTEASGDIVVTCEAFEVATGLWATPNYRLFSTGDLGRMFYTIENRTGADISVSDFYHYDNFDYTDNVLTSSGSTTVLAANDTWSINSALSDSTVSGSAWALPGNTATTSTGDPQTNYESFHDFVDLTFEAGSTMYVASYVTTHLPASPFDSADVDAAMVVAAAAMTEFNSFSGRLVSGLPAGITVLNWGAVPGAAAPALADTGVNGTALAFAGTGALVLVLGGVGLVVSRRRRETV